jgi:hypothetical protein
MRWMIAAALVLAAAGCNGRPMRTDDQFAPGKWRVEGWMETGGISTRGREGEIKPQIVNLTPEQVAQHPGAVFFTYFYHGVPKDAEISFRDGKIDGTFHQRRVDDISAQDVKISGAYGPKHFRVTFGYGAFGTAFDQVVEGELIEPAS